MRLLFSNLHRFSKVHSQDFIANTATTRYTPKMPQLYMPTYQYIRIFISSSTNRKTEADTVVDT